MSDPATLVCLAVGDDSAFERGGSDNNSAFATPRWMGGLTPFRISTISIQRPVLRRPVVSSLVVRSPVVRGQWSRFEQCAMRHARDTELLTQRPSLLLPCHFLTDQE